jgi:para-aminobenzoate synthetase/4-amino-4-deoxychorismate lyase
LARDPKERAERTMIVGQEARPGSARVGELFTVERHPGLEHLVATVGAEAPGPAGAVLRALGPGGSVTGAAQRRATRLRSGTDADPRGVDTGTVGYCDDGGDMARGDPHVAGLPGRVPRWNRRWDHRRLRTRRAG